MTALISAYDRLLAQGSLPKPTREQYMLHSRRMTALIAKMNPVAAARKTMVLYSERDSGASELDDQEKRFDERARGIKAPIRYHAFSDPRDRADEKFEGKSLNEVKWGFQYPNQTTLSIGKPRPGQNQGSYQKGMGSDFASLAEREGRGTGKDFVRLGN